MLFLEKLLCGVEGAMTFFAAFVNSCQIFHYSFFARVSRSLEKADFLLVDFDLMCHSQVNVKVATDHVIHIVPFISVVK